MAAKAKRKKPKQETCPRTRKICYPTQEDANAHLWVIQFGSLAWRKERESYHCPHCNKWHLTSKDYDEERRKG